MRHSGLDTGGKYIVRYPRFAMTDKSLKAEFMRLARADIFRCCVRGAEILCALFILPFAADLTPAFSEDIPPDAADLPRYSAKPLGDSQIVSVGSDSMGGLLEEWTRLYKVLQPNARVSLVSRGSALAPAALVEGNADLGPMARPMKAGERKVFREKFGFEPTEIKTAFAALAVFVHRDNPLNDISLIDLDAIFSADPKRAERSAFKWKDLGVTGAYGEQEILPVARTKDSYARDYFKQQVLMQTEFSSRTVNVASIDALAQALEANPYAIGFSEISPDGLAIKKDGVRVLNICRRDRTDCKAPTAEGVYNGSYPLARSLNIYILRKPEEKLEPGVEDFLRFVLSKQGQVLVAKEGFIPLQLKNLTLELSKLD